MLKTMCGPLIGIFVALASGVAQTPAVSQGALQVSVADSSGAALAAASVRYARLPGKTVAAGSQLLPAPGEASVTGQSAADTNGNLTVGGLAPGAYAVCASVPGAPYLDPCIWRQPVRVTVSGGATAVQPLTLTKGVFLNVQVDDPAGLLGTPSPGLWDRPKLLIGVMYGNGAYQGLQLTSASATQRAYQLAIPTGVAFTLRLFSRDVAVSDESGAAVDVSGSRIAFRGTPGQDLTFEFKVSGTAAK